MLNGYDIIGDIHGHADKLEALLVRLGYTRVGGVWRHPERMVVFLGDYIDRGPQILETLKIIRDMREAGAAECIMGNHEFNAICWNTPDPDNPGEFLRKHTESHARQHSATLEQLAGCYQSWIHWMRTLPLWLELGDLGGDDGRLHMIHACWSPDDMRTVVQTEYRGELIVTGRNDAPRMSEKGFIPAGRDIGTDVYGAMERLLKGPEISLPESYAFKDKDGCERRSMRIQWWKSAGGPLRELALMGKEEISMIPEDIQTDPTVWTAVPVEYPTFFGHYWLNAEIAGNLMAKNVVCLDFSAGKGGDLAAYRWNRGDTCLKRGQLVWIGDGKDLQKPAERRVFFP